MSGGTVRGIPADEAGIRFIHAAVPAGPIGKAPTMTEPQLTAREPLCDLQMVKAEYGTSAGKDGKPGQWFRIKLVSTRQTVSFDISEPDGEQFAAELEALAAIIRSRVIRARMIGEERI
jgi:hypothetical protein